MYLSCSFHVYASRLNQNGSNTQSPPFALAINHCIKLRGKLETFRAISKKRHFKQPHKHWTPVAFIETRVNCHSDDVSCVHRDTC